jgi:hypothetical protein
MWYNAARDFPGMDSMGMDSYDMLQAVAAGK